MLVLPSRMRAMPSSTSGRKPFSTASVRISFAVARRATSSSRSPSMRRISMIAVRPR